VNHDANVADVSIAPFGIGAKGIGQIDPSDIVAEGTMQGASPPQQLIGVMGVEGVHVITE
jgi:hypothetical protein